MKCSAYSQGSIKSFGGNVTAWTTFWDSYNATIHENNELSNIERFSYLRSLLTHGAAEAMSGLTLTYANYKEDVQILTKLYGNKQQIVNKHLEQLLCIDAVSSQHDAGAEAALKIGVGVGEGGGAMLNMQIFTFPRRLFTHELLICDRLRQITY